MFAPVLVFQPQMRHRQEFDRVFPLFYRNKKTFQNIELIIKLSQQQPDLSLNNKSVLSPQRSPIPEPEAGK